jgi:hypothetical protein
MWLRDKKGKICGQVLPPGPRTAEEVANAAEYAPVVGEPRLNPEGLPIERILVEGRARRARELASIDLKSSEPISTGLSREAALRIFTATVNQPDTLFSIDTLLPEKLNQMRELLHDPISADEADALVDVLYKRKKFTDMIGWLRDEPVAWDGYFLREKIPGRGGRPRLAAYLKQQDEDWARGIGKYAAKVSPEEVAWAKAAYLGKARPCCRCGTPAEVLEWSRFHSSPSAWRHFSAGWQTHCKFCLHRVDLFISVMGRGRRPIVPEHWK